MMKGKDGDFHLVKVLIGLNDEDVAAITYFDLGEFCMHDLNGKSIVKRLVTRCMLSLRVVSLL